MQHPKHKVEKAAAVQKPRYPQERKNGVSLTVRQSRQKATLLLSIPPGVNVPLMAKQGDGHIVEAHLLLPFKKRSRPSALT